MCLDLPAAVPEDARAAVHDALAAVPPYRARDFVLRAGRWWPDLHEALRGLYPHPEQVAGRVLVAAAAAYAARDDDLHVEDARRSLQPDWFQHPATIGYAAYADRFAAPGTGLAGVADRIGHLTRLGVRYLHLMPLLTPRPGNADGGYAVADYRSVRPDLGTIDDLRELATRLREAGITLCLDLVLNHVAREHPWAQAARDGDPHYRRYFHVFGNRDEADAYEATLPEVFPTFAPGNFTWDEDLDAWVWTTFNDFQWDLAWDNPDVLLEMAEVILFLANLGVGVLRLDAIAFLWKRRGTNCQNQPEVHQITQALRAMVRMACPSVLFKAEAIVGPDDLVGYLGRGRHWGRVSDLAYHNSLMVQIWSMLASRDARLTAAALGRLGAVPATTTWITYLRCHDDIGWAVDDQDAAAVHLSGPAHRGFLSDFYSGGFPGSFADGLVFQENPLTGDRRISGSAASLCGVGRAAASGDRAALDTALDRLLLAHTIVLGFGGLPVIWSGDEVAALNDEHWADEPAHADDNRWVHRPRLDDSLIAQLDEDADTPAKRVFDGLRRVIAVRGGLPQMHGAWPARVLSAPDPAVFAVLRDHPEGRMLQLYNVGEARARVPMWWLNGHGINPFTCVEHLGGRAPEVDGDDLLLAGYQALWLTA